MRNIFKLFSKKTRPEQQTPQAPAAIHPAPAAPQAPFPVKSPVPPPAVIPPETDRLDKIITRISAVKEGTALVETLRRNGVAILFTEDIPARTGDTLGVCLINTSTIGSDGTFTIKTPEIRIRPDATDDQAAIALLHEGRHALQILQGIHPLSRILSKEDFVTMTQFVEADASSFALLVALKIFVANRDGALMHAALRSEEDDQAMGLMLNTISQSLELVNHPIVPRAFFEAWFNAASLKASYDANSVKNWEAIQPTIASYTGFITAPPRPLTAAEVIPLGALSGSENYLLIPEAQAVTVPYRLPAAPAAPVPAAPRPPSMFR